MGLIRIKAGEIVFSGGTIFRTRREAAKHLGVSLSTLARKLREARIIRAEVLRAWEESQRVTPEEVEEFFSEGVDYSEKV